MRCPAQVHPAVVVHQVLALEAARGAGPVPAPAGLNGSCLLKARESGISLQRWVRAMPATSHKSLTAVVQRMATCARDHVCPIPSLIFPTAQFRIHRQWAAHWAEFLRAAVTAPLRAEALNLVTKD